MCLPILAGVGLALGASAGAAAAVGTVAVGSLALGATSTVLNTVAASKAAKSQKQQLAIQAETAQQNSELARINAKAATDAAEYNASNLLRLTQVNATARQSITDINVALADSISNFNTQVADGQAQLLLGKGDLEAAYAGANAAAARIDAANLEDTAQAAITASHRDEQSSRLNYARLKSTQRANLAANGVALDEGSALRIQTDTDYFSDVDADTIHANGVRAAMGYRAQATNSLIEAQMADTQGKVALINAKTEAATVKAQAFGAKMAADRDVLNMKMSTSFEILQARSNAEIESANMLNQGRIEATNYEMQAAGFSGAAASANAQRKGISPFFSGASAFVDGASSVASKWYGYAKAGAFG